MSTDRLLDSLRELIRAEFPQFTFAGTFEYSVTEARREGNATTFDGRPTASTVPLPDAVRWPLRPGVSGSQFVPASGSLVYVTFANMDPAKPIAFAFDGETPDDPLTISSGNVTDLTGIGRVVRYGDPIVFSSPGPGTVSAGLVVNHFSRVKA